MISKQKEEKMFLTKFRYVELLTNESEFEIKQIAQVASLEMRTPKFNFIQIFQYPLNRRKRSKVKANQLKKVVEVCLFT